MFLWGFGGSIAVEVITLYQLLQSQDELPQRYRKIPFWIVRLALAMIGGALTVAYEIQKPLLALNIGASTPIIIQTLTQGFRPSSGSVKGEVN